jgi:hypothetical protein
MSKPNLKGKTFGRLTAVSRIGTEKGHVIWLFRCECGGRKKTRLSHVRTGEVRSCGCLSNENRARISRAHRKHGLSNSAEFKVYCSAKHRCSDPKRPNYAGKGIKFRFKSFEEFYKELGPRPSPEHSLDRVTSTSDYAPGQCRWATAQEQSWNRGKFRGKYTSTYKGVCKKSRPKKARWLATICQDGRNYRLGSFSNEEEAAAAYDQAAIARCGAFACLNFPAESYA